MKPKKSITPRAEILAGIPSSPPEHEYTVGDKLSPEEIEEKRKFILLQRRELAKTDPMFAIQCQIDDGIYDNVSSNQ